jgi:hypothetical protein
MGGGGGGERRDNGGQVRQKITYSKKLGELLWSLLQKVGKGGVTPQKVALLPSPSRPTQNTIIQIIKTPPPHINHAYNSRNTPCKVCK